MYVLNTRRLRVRRRLTRLVLGCARPVVILAVSLVSVVGWLEGIVGGARGSGIQGEEGVHGARTRRVRRLSGGRLVRAAAAAGAGGLAAVAAPILGLRLARHDAGYIFTRKIRRDCFRIFNRAQNADKWPPMAKFERPRL